MPRPAVIIMVKAPRAGEVKTRLMPPLSGAQAASLAACFARDVLAKAASVVPDIIVAYAPADGRTLLETIFSHAGLTWIEQRGADLGARLSAVVARASARGFSPLIIVGTDSPTLPSSFIETARDALASGETDITLGPTDDGGYYLVGLARPVAGIFHNVAWSTPRAYQQTAANAARLNLKLLRLPDWYDVDTPPDLLRLREEIFNDPAARRRAPATYRWLRARTEADG